MVEHGIEKLPNESVTDVCQFPARFIYVGCNFVNHPWLLVFHWFSSEVLKANFSIHTKVRPLMPNKWTP